MTNKEIYCDKCKKKINLNEHSHIDLTHGYQLDLCEECFRKMLVRIGDWIYEVTE